MKHRYYFLLFFFLAVTQLYAQVTVKLQAPSQTEVGQRVRISYVVNTNDVDDIKIGDFQGFNVLYGPSTSSQSSISMINGKTTHNSSMTFTYTVAATKEGTFEIPAATVTVDGKTYKSGTGSIEVLPASSRNNSSGGGTQQHGGAQSQNGARQRQESSSESSNIGSQELYMTVSATKRRIYEQEAVLLTYKLYTLVNVQQISGEMPELDGFHVQEVDSKAQMSLKYERVNGRNYGTAVWRQYVLFPQKTGKVKVPSITFDTQVEVQNTSMDPFDIFFGGGSLSQIVKKSIVAPAIEIEVLPLPTPKPQNFSGAVGKFTLSGSLTPEQLNANDAATLRLVVSGQGNMKLMKAPKVNFPKDFEVYDPKQDDKTTNTSVGAKGNVIYDYIIVPRHGGKYSIPPVEFSYFDPDRNAYQTLKTDSFAIAVAKAKGGSDNIREQEDLMVLNNDIRFIKLNNMKLKKSDSSFFGSPLYWGIYAGLSALFLIFLAIFNRQARENANIARQRGKKAGKAATKRLRNASKLLKEHQSGPFYDEIMRALLGYVADKLNLPTSDLTKENVSEKLVNRGVNEDLMKSFLDVLEECEFARFAPGDPNETMDKIYSEATDVINRMDSSINKV